MSMNAHPPKGDEDLTLWELLRSVKAAWRWLVSGAVTGMLSALTFLLMTPAQYEAVAIIYPATVGMYSANGTNTIAPTIRGVEVESADQVIERLKFVTFYTDALVDVCRVGSPQALVGAVSATLIKGHSLIQIKYRADSPAATGGCLLAIVNHLAMTQARLAEPLISTMEEQHQFTKQRLDEMDRLNNQLGAQGASQMSQQKFEAAAQLRKLYNEQALQLSPAVTQPVRLFEPIYASEHAIFPNKKKIMLVGLLGGLTLGCIAFFVRRSWVHRA